MNSIIQAQWKFNKDQYNNFTPSRYDGISIEDENKKRNDGIQFIKDISVWLQLQHPTIATAVIYFHRFFMRSSFKDYTKYEIGAAAIFLATKTTEVFRKIDYIAVACARVIYNDKNYYNVDEFTRWIKVIIHKEKFLAVKLCFDFIIDLPHFHLIEFLEKFSFIPEKKKIIIIRISSLIFNQTYNHPICLFYTAKDITISVIYISYKYIGLNLNENSLLGPTWWEIMDCDVFVIHNCIRDIFNTYPIPPRLNKVNVS
ncbi:cyclin-like protein [Glomus cerebriforme]|uniref:Cyclin-like protein n=1 Tax=Glomus cerebriforme TaxID=658196 RepID=A0A397SL14_9GLOM|nr:cyclin-like protein [Glomus cerebriforme]